MKGEKRMDNVKLLDCTLRDGGRVIDCKFSNSIFTNITKMLANTKMDIIEVGFLRNNIDYVGNSTFFDSVESISKILRKEEGAAYVAFIDYGMCNVSEIPNREHKYIDGIRYGFTKKNFINDKQYLKNEILDIKRKGYTVYFQDVDTNGYSDKELLELIEFANEVAPYSFGIVDTYGSMYSEDLERLFNIIDNNLDYNIAIDFHSHNNMQLSFSLAQKMIKLCSNKRELIIDCTLNGMGKGAGNLNTELIAHYMVEKLFYNYDLDLILDIIDEYLYDIKLNDFWGYSIPTFMAGVYKSHPNNIIYLTDKFKLSTKDIKHIIAMIDEDKRKTYDYNNIQRLYKEYSDNKIDDTKSMILLDNALKNREVLVLVPGTSVITYKAKILAFIEKHNPLIIAVNYLPEDYNVDYVFFGNIRRYNKIRFKMDETIPCIISSNIKSLGDNDLVVNYSNIVKSRNQNFDNSALMLLQLMKKVQVDKLFIAGFDGFDHTYNTNFVDDSFYNNRFVDKFDLLNKAISDEMIQYLKQVKGKIQVRFVTPSRFSNGLEL